MQLHCPLGQFGAQAARQLVGLVEVDVEQRDADAQRADVSDLLIDDGVRSHQTFGQLAIDVKVKVEIDTRTDTRTDTCPDTCVDIDCGYCIGLGIKPSVGQRYEPGAQVDEVRQRIKFRFFNDIGYWQRFDGVQLEELEQRIGRGVHRDRNTRRRGCRIRPGVDARIPLIVQPG